MVYCSQCGEIYRRIAWNNHGKYSTVWRCVTRVEHGPTACDAATIKEEDLQQLTMTAINRLASGSKDMIPLLKHNITVALGPSGEEEYQRIERELQAAQQEISQRALDGKSCDELGEKIKSLMERKKMALKDRALQTGDSQKIQQLLDYLELEPTEPEEYDEALSDF